MKRVQRQRQLLAMLLKQVGHATSKYYANELHVSERTIFSDLKSVEHFLQLEGFEVSKQPGIGIEIRKTSENKLTVEKVVREDMYSTEGRRKKIMEWLLFAEKTVTFEELSEFFLVSRSSLKNDMKFIEKTLTNGNELVLVSDGKGTRFVGNERNIQKAYLEFNQHVFTINPPLFEKNDERKMHILATYYGASNVKACTRVLYSYLKKEETPIAEHYVFTVLNMMIVLVYRTKMGHHLAGKTLFSDAAETHTIFDKNAADMLNKISIRMGIDFTKADGAYLSTYLISNKFEPLSMEKNYRKIVTTFINKVGESLGIDFSKDLKLVTQLNLHIPPMIYRLQEGIQINNPFIFQIKNEFALIFNLIWVTLSEYEEELAVIFNEEEIGFLTIYFQSAVDRAKLSKKILIVCPTGIATSEILLNRIRNVLPYFNAIEVISLKEVQGVCLDEIDLVISTVQLELPAEKLMVVSPLLSKVDMKNISDRYNQMFVQGKPNSKQPATFPSLRRFVTEACIYLEENFKSKEELLQEIGVKLVAQNYVTTQFIESMLTRERLGGTDLPTGAAIPHGNPKYVQQTTVVFVRNRKPIKWESYSVKLVMIICVAENDTKQIRNILADVYRIVENKELLNVLVNVKNKKELEQQIGCEVGE